MVGRGFLYFFPVFPFRGFNAERDLILGSAFGFLPGEGDVGFVDGSICDFDFCGFFGGGEGVLGSCRKKSRGHENCRQETCGHGTHFPENDFIFHRKPPLRML